MAVLRQAKFGRLAEILWSCLINPTPLTSQISCYRHWLDLEGERENNTAEKGVTGTVVAVIVRKDDRRIGRLKVPDLPFHLLILALDTWSNGTARLTQLLCVGCVTERAPDLVYRYAAC